MSCFMTAIKLMFIDSINVNLIDHSATQNTSMHFLKPKCTALMSVLTKKIKKNINQRNNKSDNFNNKLILVNFIIKKYIFNKSRQSDR